MFYLVEDYWEWKDRKISKALTKQDSISSVEVYFIDAGDQNMTKIIKGDASESGNCMQRIKRGDKVQCGYFRWIGWGEPLYRWHNMTNILGD